MPSLRSKIRTKCSAIKTTVTDKADLQLSDVESVKIDAIAPDDTSAIAIPPKARAATKGSVRRVSPSRSPLENHKHCSNSSRNSLDLDSGLPAAVSKQRHPASLPSNIAALPRTGDMETAAEMEIATLSPEKSANLNTSEVDKPRADAKYPAARRKTRSQSRRHNRVDSHDSMEMTSQQISTNFTESDNKESEMAGEQPFEASGRTSQVPRSLSIRKQGTSGTPSPRSPSEEDIPPLPPLSPARKGGSNCFRTPSPGEQSPAQTLSPKPMKVLIPAAPRSSPAAQSRDSPPKGASMKERLAFARARPPSPPLDDESKMVAVRPPLYDMSKGLCQWISDLPSTSRPDRVWEWPKRWTCCRCDATTIVEQKICSDLTCSHYRCPNDCQMIRISRPLGQL